VNLTQSVTAAQSDGHGPVMKSISSAHGGRDEAAERTSKLLPPQNENDGPAFKMRPC